MSTQCWIATSLQRYFPLSPAQSRHRLSWLVARGERLSLQVCARAEGPDPVKVTVAAEPPEGLRVRVRRVGCVPMRHHHTGVPQDALDGVGYIPGYVPDPLFDEQSALVAPGETQAFWITLEVAAEAAPGPLTLPLVVQAGEERHRLTAALEVAPLQLQPRKDFPVTHWFYADALLDWYRLEPFKRGFWRILEPYLRDLAEHGTDTSHLPLFTPPTDGVKRPTQLLRVSHEGDRYRFDWSDVRRWVKLARACGLRYFEWPHFFAQWGVRHAVRVYEGQGEGEQLLWPARTGATAPAYRHFLAQLLPELYQFLRREKLLDCSFFHVSDEPHGPEAMANYRRARGLLRELAPWMRVMDALSEIEYGREHLTDMPIPILSTARQFYEEGLPSWAYFCCGPRERYVQRLLDTPLANTRFAGWLLYRFRREGFLHWGYNYWYRSQTRELIDPYTVQDAGSWPGWGYGDPFVVYPGPSGPVDSLRWEVFADSLQDYALLQTVGADPEGKLLAPLRDFNDFPRDEAWLWRTRAKLLA